MCRLRPGSNRLCPGWSQLRLHPPPEPRHPGSNQRCTLPARPRRCCWCRRGCLCPHRRLRSHLRRSLALSPSLCLTATLSLSLSLSTRVLLLNILSLIFHRLAHLMVFLSSCLSHLSPPLFVLLFLFLVLSSSSFPPFLPSGWPEDDKLTLCVVLFRTSLAERNIAARASPRHAEASCGCCCCCSCCCCCCCCCSSNCCCCCCCSCCSCCCCC